MFWSKKLREKTWDIEKWNIEKSEHWKNEKFEEKNGNWENIDTKHNNLGKINIKNKSEKANESAGIANYRGIGVSETVDAIKNNRLNRCSGELSLHVLDILDSIITSSKENKKIELRSSIKNLNYLSEDEISNLLK